MDTHALLREGGPYIVSGLLMLSGLLLSFVRDLPRKAGAALSRVLIASVSISNDDPLFNIAQVWLDAHPYTRKIRNFTAKSALSDEDDDSLEQPTFLLTPAFGEHLFRHRGHLVWLERARDGASGEGRGRREPRERLTFRMFRGDRPALEALIDDMIAAHVARRRARMPVYVNLAYGWHTIGARAARSLDSLVLTEGVLETIVADIESFRASRDWYRSMGIPFRRGFLLHGPPGTGKSSLVGALAGRFEAPLYALSLTGNDFTDADLIELLHDVAPDAFVLLEDLDVAFNGREPGSKGVTMSGLLNAIDGAASKDGSVLFVSTNHVERLDPALRRPGRLDVQLELGYADFSQRRRLFERFFPRSTRGDTFAGRSSEVPLTIAELQEYLLEHRHDESLALGDVAEWARDRRQINGATSSPTHDESGCGRLVRKRIRERRPDTGFLSSRPQRSDVGVEEALWRTAYCSAGATGRDAERPSPAFEHPRGQKKRQSQPICEAHIVQLTLSRRP
ncbi:MAG: AAA family ATPase [Candidatus Eremiobacteraeota bacterium]|nr:AAA family ATPase [Candidatus Eremiobacteraeota bacterium]